MEDDLDAVACLGADGRIGQIAAQEVHLFKPVEVLVLAGTEVIYAPHAVAAL
jgi:hypothetical protein